MDIEDTIWTTLEDIAREMDNYPYVLSEETISNIKSIFEEAKNYQKENCALKQQLKKNEAVEKVVSELKPQLEERDNKIKNLETKISNQIEETEMLHDQLSKSSEDLEETRKHNVILKKPREQKRYCRIN